MKVPLKSATGSTDGGSMARETLDPAAGTGVRPTPEAVPARTRADVDAVEVADLVEGLNAAFAVELARHRAVRAGTPSVASSDGGTRFAGGLLVAAVLGALIWAALIGLIVVVG